MMRVPLLFFRCRSAAFFFFCFFFQPNVLLAARDTPRVFIVHSYSPQSLISQPQDEGLTQGLAESGFIDGETVEIKRFFMDTKRTYTRPDQIASRGKQALSMIADFHPDVVITVDDNAARTVMLPLVDSGIPVVFSGINTTPEMYNHTRRFMDSRRHPGHNVTGVYEKLYIEKSMQLLGTVVPDLKKVVFIVADSPTGNAIKAQIKSELFVSGSDILYSLRQVRTFAEYKEIIRSIDTSDEVGAYFPAALRLTSRPGEVVTGRDIFQWTLSHSHKPAFVANNVMCRLGALGGVTVDFIAMGRQAALKAASILQGAKAGDIAIEDAAEYAIAFNIARAKELGIRLDPDLLSAAAVIYESTELDTAPKAFQMVLVQSEAQGLGSGADVEKGMLAELKSNGVVEGKNIAICRHFVKPRCRFSIPEQIHEQGIATLEKIYRADPDLVVTLGDIAAKEVMLPLVDSEYPVLFGSTMLPPEWYNKYREFMKTRSFPGHNVSGVTGEFQYAKSMDFVHVLFPEAKNIVLIYSGDFTWKENLHVLLQEQIDDCCRRYGFDSIQLKEVRTVAEFKRLILQYNTDPKVDIVSAVFPAGLLRNDGTVCPVAEILEWVVSHQLKPDFTFADSWVRYGYLMAAAVDFEAMGHQLGRQVLAVLRGHDVGEMSIQSPEDSYLAINRARADQLGIHLPVTILEAADKVYDTMEPEKAH